MMKRMPYWNEWATVPYPYTSSLTPGPSNPLREQNGATDFSTYSDPSDGAVHLAGPAETTVPLVAYLRSEGWTCEQEGPGAFACHPPA